MVMGHGYSCAVRSLSNSVSVGSRQGMQTTFIVAHVLWSAETLHGHPARRHLIARPVVFDR